MKKPSLPCKYVLLLLTVVLLPMIGTAKNCLWKATKDQHTIYVQGSVHVLKAENYPLDPAIEQVYAESGTLVFEADLKEMTSPETQKMIMSKAVFEHGRTLKSELSPDVYALLAAELKETGMPEAAVQSFKPWFVSILILVPRMQAMGLNPELGLDQYFYRKATADGKKVVGLESLEFQFNLFDTLSDEDQDAFTRYFLKDLKQNLTMIPEILAAWKNGDIETLNGIFTEGFKEYPDMFDQFLTRRNRDWVRKLSQMPAAEKPVMVVVGAGHLGGETGLVALLEAEGFTLEQL